jgi:hypothetical protein
MEGSMFKNLFTKKKTEEEDLKLNEKLFLELIAGMPDMSEYLDMLLSSINHNYAKSLELSKINLDDKKQEYTFTSYYLDTFKKIMEAHIVVDKDLEVSQANIKVIAGRLEALYYPQLRNAKLNLYDITYNDGKVTSKKYHSNELFKGITSDASLEEDSFSSETKQL